MRTKKKELDVDFIGSQEPLSSSEEKALSEFFKKRKEIKKPKSLRPRRTTKKVTTEIQKTPQEIKAQATTRGVANVG